MDIHKNLHQTTELDIARNDLSVEKKLLDCIENLVMNDDFTAAVNSVLTTILEYYDADRTYFVSVGGNDIFQYLLKLFWCIGCLSEQKIHIVRFCIIMRVFFESIL